MTDSPIPMRIPCPECKTLHIDEGIWATKLHHTHSCQSCGLTWRPAVVHTVGVRFLPGFKNDEPEGVTRIKRMTGMIGLIEPGQQWQHLKVDTQILTVKEVGHYANGVPKVSFTNGSIMPEQTLRSGYRIYTPDPILPGQTWQHCVDHSFVRVKAIGTYPTDPTTRKIIFDDGCALEEGWFRKHYRLFPSTIGPKQILCVVAGENILVDYNALTTLSDVRLQALEGRKAHLGISDNYAATWVICNIHGDRLPPEALVGNTPSLLRSEPALYINPPVGHGG